MKPIRYTAAALFLLTGILHIIFSIKTRSDPQFVITLAFGIVYFTLGVFLILKKRFAIWLGFIIPIIPLALSPFMMDFKDPWMIIFLSIDLVVVICCLILLLNKNKD